MKRSIILLLIVCAQSFAFTIIAREIDVHTTNTHQGHDQIYIEPPYVTYDDDLNELYVYFGTTGTIDLEYDDGTGAPYYYIYGESHYGGYTATYTNLPAGYFTITIHSVYGYTYTGNFTVY